MTLTEKVMQRAQADITGLVEEHMERIWSCMKQAQEEAEAHGDEKSPTYKVGLTISLVPIGQHVVNVSAAISYGTKIKDETVDQNISDHPELPGLNK
jgi:hypothetical protein